MSAVKNFELCFKVLIANMECVGFNIFRPNYKFNIISYLVFFDIATYMCINFYDVYLFWGDLVKVCFCLVTFTFGLQGIIRIHVILTKQIKIEDAKSCYAKYEVEEPRIAQLYGDRLLLHLKYQLVFYYGCALVTLLYPALVYLVSREKVLPFGFVIPGLSSVEQPGYALNYIHHFIQVFFTICGIVCVQMFVTIFIITVCMKIDITILKMKNLSNKLYKELNILETELFEQLIEIISFHRDALE